MSEIYIGSHSHLSVARGWVEDEIERAMGDVGEVTGGGQGVTGWNIDIEVYEKEDVREAIRRIKPVLISNRATENTTMSVYWESSDEEGEEIDFLTHPTQ